MHRRWWCNTVTDRQSDRQSDRNGDARCPGEVSELQLGQAGREIGALDDHHRNAELPIPHAHRVIQARDRANVTNEDQTAHTFTVPRLDIDENIEGGGQVLVTVDRTGTFDYVCTFHPPGMLGRLVVTDSPSTATGTATTTPTPTYGETGTATETPTPTQTEGDGLY